MEKKKEMPKDLNLILRELNILYIRLATYNEDIKDKIMEEETPPALTLTLKTKYITAQNIAGESVKSFSVWGIPKGLPSQPLNFSIKSENKGILITWEKPDNNGGSTILNYRIYRGANFESMDLLIILEDNEMEYLDESADSGKFFYYVTASNEIGESPPTEIMEISTDNSVNNLKVYIIISIILFFVLFSVLMAILLIRKSRNRNKPSEQIIPTETIISPIPMDTGTLSNSNHQEYNDFQIEPIPPYQVNGLDEKK